MTALVPLHSPRKNRSAPQDGPETGVWYHKLAGATTARWSPRIRHAQVGVRRLVRREPTDGKAGPRIAHQIASRLSRIQSERETIEQILSLYGVKIIYLWDEMERETNWALPNQQIL